MSIARNTRWAAVITSERADIVAGSFRKFPFTTVSARSKSFAYTAGDEANIRLATPAKTETENEPQQIAINGEFVIVNYSEKAIALFGDTRPIKDKLSAIGGRFNGRLTHEGEKGAGWIFQKTKEAQVRELIGITE